MAYTFLKAQGEAVGKSLVEEDKGALAKDLLQQAKATSSSSCCLLTMWSPTA